MIHQGHPYMIEHWAAEWQFFIARAWHLPWVRCWDHASKWLHTAEDAPSCMQLKSIRPFCLPKLNKTASLNHSLSSFLPERDLYSGEGWLLEPLLERCFFKTSPMNTPPHLPFLPPLPPPEPLTIPLFWKWAERSHELKMILSSLSQHQWLNKNVNIFFHWSL